MNSPLAVIIPCLNEEENLKLLLPQLCSRQDTEVIVVDGGSTDDSCALAGQYDCQVVRSPLGRGLQMNRGARATRCRKLLFLHADTRLPYNFPILIDNGLTQDNTAGGAFSLATDRKDLAMSLICFGANVRSRLLHLPYGDQAIFTARSHFEAVGGFPEVEIMEDYIFIRKLGKRGKIVILEEKAVTSARRWEHLGFIRTTLINQLMVAGYCLGIAPQRLARLYRRVKGLGRREE